jgi:hypothetical protein
LIKPRQTWLLKVKNLKNMPSLLDWARNLFGITDPSQLTDEQLSVISQKMREGQSNSWQTEAPKFGLTEKTPEAQQIKDEQINPTSIKPSGGENKG